MFKELYYWMSTRLAKIKSNDNPPFNAYFIINVLQIFNIVTLLMIVNYFVNIILPNNRANGLVKNSFNFNTRYDKTNTTQILA